MSIHHSCRTTAALTLIEVLVVCAVMVVLIGVLLPALSRAKARSKGISCVNCLKQVGLSARIFATDNEGKFPWQVSTNASGSREYLNVPHSSFRHFLAMSNELSTPKLLLCPKDKERITATNWSISNQNISYFLGPDAKLDESEVWLSGDRNLMTNSISMGNGILELTTNLVIGWTAQMHNNAGNVLFGDGHVDSFSNNRLQEQLIDCGVATNRLLIP